jgi:cellulose synthase/poly-beta-1,6-N-acetylglucosamine synthase-like glycosyltransferase
MLPAALSWAIYLFVGLTAMAVVVLAAQVAGALLSDSIRPSPMAALRPTVAVLVPAHNEASGIVATCDALRSQLEPGDRLLVVADNCSDDTVSLARMAGATVVERRDNTRTGKGYALAFGLKRLAENPPEIIVVVDADCTPGPQAVSRLARTCAAVQRPVQANYRMRSSPGASLRLRVAEFAAIVKNLVRPLGYRSLGLPCLLMGTGMAFPWRIVERTDFASGHLVEDMKLALELAEAGFPPYFCPEAEVDSNFPDSDSGFDAQRTRWEHGHLGLILSDVPAALIASIGKRNLPQFAVALDIFVPPISFLAMLAAISIAASAGIWWMSGAAGLLWVSVATFLVLAIAIGFSWWKFARDSISARELAFLPLYALTKLPLYLRFVHRRQAQWVRSPRKGE